MGVIVRDVRIIRFTRKREIERDEEKQRRILLNRRQLPIFKNAIAINEGGVVIVQK